MTTAPRLLVALLLVLSAVTIHAQDDGLRSYEGHWWCSSMDPAGPVYITGLWSGKYIMTEVANSFAQELLAKYAYSGRVNCARANPGATAAQIQSGPTSQIAAWRSSGRKVVEIPWVYDPAKARLPHLCTAFVTVEKGVNIFYHNKVLRIPGGTQPELSTAWAAHVKARHPGAHFPVPMGCNLLPADPAKHQSNVDGNVRLYERQKPQVVQLDWMHDPAVPAGSIAGQPFVAPVAATGTSPVTTPVTAAPPIGKPAGAPPAAPPATTASVQHAVCYADADSTTRYFSAVFDGTRGDYADWMPAFQQYLVQTYKYRGFVRCNRQPSQAAAQKYRDNLITAARAATLAGGAKLKVVDTGWIYKGGR